jgi:hypothetical protein
MLLACAGYSCFATAAHHISLACGRVLKSLPLTDPGPMERYLHI